uniref:Protein DCLic n=1 Tax=Rhizophora mucronata TaxID=61149 RepID=A0A2P2JN33_RHIMU
MKNHSGKSNKRNRILQNPVLPIDPFIPFFLLVVLRRRHSRFPQQVRPLGLSLHCTYARKLER